jgi:hypothetical protein
MSNKERAKCDKTFLNTIPSHRRLFGIDQSGQRKRGKRREFAL